MKPILVALIAAIGASAGAQMSGAYSIGPSGSFATFQAACDALAAQGVNGPVTFQVAPGNYNESFLIKRAPGASASNTITFQSVVPGMAKLFGTTGPTATFIMGGSTTQGIEWYVLDGLEFASGPSNAIRGNMYTYDIEIKNCVFQAAHVGRLWHVSGRDEARRWHVHHCRFTLPAGADGFYLEQISFWNVHHNEFELNGCQRGIYPTNLNNAQNIWHNNIFHGAVAPGASNAALYFAASNYENICHHNTIVVNTTASAICTQGSTAAKNRFYDNIVVALGGGTCVRVYHSPSSPNFSHYLADNNLYHAPGGAIGYWDKAYATLPAWQAAMAAFNAAGDANSRDLPPGVASLAAPYDFRLRPGSAAINTARYTPAYVTDDHSGRPRDPWPDIGAFEYAGAGFSTYGRGCAGTGAIIPAIGSQGTASIGATGFAITCGRGLGGAPALFCLGVNSASWSGVPLPFSLGGGCLLYQDLVNAISIVLQGSGAGKGSASVPLPIPNQPALAGGTVFAQWLVLDPAAANAFGLATSNAGRIGL